MTERPPSGPEPLVDVEELVDDLRERVERERAAGRYTDDVASVPLEPVGSEPPATPDRGATPAARPPQVVYHPEVGYSSRPLIGPVLTAVKRLFYRLFFYPLDDLARQTSDAVQYLNDSDRRIEQSVAAETATALGLRERIDTLANQLELSHRLTAESIGRDVQSIGRDVQSLAIRLAELEATHERLQLQSRLGRLERLVRTAPRAAPSEAVAAPTAQAGPTGGIHEPPSFDYMTFENRFRPEQTVRERHSEYVELLGTCKRVVDLGCGRGELLELLRKANVSAYGVELNPDNVAVCREKGLEIVEGDAVSHLEGLDDGTLDGIVASHLIEHLETASLWRLITVAIEKLDENGILILETPNPESLLAGSINFHRDPTHVRPVHPDTLSFLCESAGFGNVEIRRLAPVPTNERLPQQSPNDNPLAAHLSQVVEQLNDVIYGYQDYALIARV
jgi:SAM-dependent methyltransferase